MAPPFGLAGSRQRTNDSIAGPYFSGIGPCVVSQLVDSMGPNQGIPVNTMVFAPYFINQPSRLNRYFWYSTYSAPGYTAGIGLYTANPTTFYPQNLVTATEAVLDFSTVGNNITMLPDFVDIQGFYWLGILNYFQGDDVYLSFVKDQTFAGNIFGVAVPYSNPLLFNYSAPTIYVEFPVAQSSMPVSLAPGDLRFSPRQDDIFGRVPFVILQDESA